jgi:hypothetical protein
MSKVSFTPNTITYTAKGEEADKIKRAKVGVVVHTQYHGKDLGSMKADPHPDTEKFKQHPDVWHKSAEHDTSKVHYAKKTQDTFQHHMDAAKDIHEKHGHEMYAATEKHQGDVGHLSTYINHTVRTGEKPTAAGLQKHIMGKHTREAEKVKTDASKEKKLTAGKEHVEHIEQNKKHYNNLLNMHGHLQKAKDVLVHTLNQHEGGLEHDISGKKTQPEGFVVHHGGEPTKLVNRKEFARANLLKVRK